MYPFSSPGIFIVQPFGQFALTTLPARVLLDTAFSDRLTAILNPDGTYRLDGSQRRLAEPRLKEIGKFVDTSAACFPNAIILAANYKEEDGLQEEDEEVRWSFDATENSQPGTLQIPKALKRAAIIDGQHRLFGFNYIENKARLDMSLVCAIFFDLPKPYQARLFATINANQRPVSKSQTYELFGYNMEEEPPEKWTPEKLAVFLARKLNAEDKSPFHQHIVVPAENDFSASLAQARHAGDWAVSLATVVEGTLRLISSNPKSDANKMAGEWTYEGRDRTAIDATVDSPKNPLRGVYREGNDEIIYTAIFNYFSAVQDTLWADTPADTFIKKTVGVQALFDIFRPLLFDAVKKRDLRVIQFVEKLSPAKGIDFTDPFFHASGAGRTKIRKTLEYAIGLATLSEDESSFLEFKRILKR